MKETKEKRSAVIKSIKSKGTAPEKIVDDWLSSSSFSGKYIKNCKEAVGTPDFFFPDFCGFLFVDGGFWHGHSKHFKFGKSGPYWDKKILRNIAKDKEVDAAILETGGNLLRVWDFEILDKKEPDVCKSKILRWANQCFKKAKDIPPSSLREGLPFWEIFSKALSRQEKGILEYGDDSYKELDMFEEMEEELLDVMVYAYLQVVKVRGMAKRTRRKNEDL